MEEINKIDFGLIEQRIKQSIKEDEDMWSEEEDKLKSKVAKFIQNEDMEEGTVVQTHVNYYLDQTDPDYFTRMMNEQ